METDNYSRLFDIVKHIQTKTLSEEILMSPGDKIGTNTGVNPILSIPSKHRPVNSRVKDDKKKVFRQKITEKKIHIFKKEEETYRKKIQLKREGTSYHSDIKLGTEERLRERRFALLFQRNVFRFTSHRD